MESLEFAIEDKKACLKCGGICCKTKNMVVPLSDSEAKAIPTNLVSIVDTHPIIASDETGCKALESNGCSLGELKPVYCRIFPLKVIPIGRFDVGDYAYVAGHAIVLGNCIKINDFSRRAERLSEFLERNRKFYKRIIDFSDRYGELMFENNLGHFMGCLKLKEI